MTTARDLDTELLDHAVRVATTAPSVHNTQPWRLVRQGHDLELWADRSRQLRVLDPGGRLLVTSCGVLLHHLRVALVAVGFGSDVALLPDPTQPDLLARIEARRQGEPSDAQVADAVAELQRTTVRGRFGAEPLPTGLLDQLEREVCDHGAMLRAVRGDELVDVQVLVARAERYLEVDVPYQAELARWVHEGPGVDGIPLEALDVAQDRAELVVGRAYVPHGDAPHQDVPPIAEHPTLVVLLTEGDLPFDWLRVGQALSRLLLTCTEHGVVAQPIGQVTDIPSTRTALAGALGVLGRPQVLLRLGRGHGEHHTARRPLEDLLEVHDS